MTVEIDTSELETEFETLSREEAKEAANRWFSTSQEALYSGGDEHDYDVKLVAKAALPPQWDETLGGFAHHWPHEATQFFNAGTAPHEIEASDGVLAFEWQNAPTEIRESFEDTFPTVFFKSVSVDGIEAIRFFERGEQAARQFLEGH